MSCYEWESGVVKVPAKDYVVLRKATIQKYNALKLELFSLAIKIIRELKTVCRGCKKDALKSKATQYIEDRCPDSYAIRSLIFKLKDNRMVGFKTPKKKDLNILPISRGACLELDDFSIVFNDDAKTVRWIVSENNHAIGTAHDHPLAKLLFGLLSGVDWTRNSGGIICGNDEYNSDNDYPGGGGNYITHRFGPLGAGRALHYNLDR